MIANERQYRITRVAARDFEEALARLETVEAHRSPEMRRVMREAMESQLEDLRDHRLDGKVISPGVPRKCLCIDCEDVVLFRGAATVLRGVRIRLHLELLDFVHRRNSGNGVEIGRSVHGPIQQEVRILSASATDGVLVGHSAADVADFLECGVAVLCEGDTGT